MKAFIAASVLLMLTLSSSAFEIFPGYAGQRRHRLTLHRKMIADGIQLSSNARALEVNQLLPNDAEEQSTGIASTSSTYPTIQSSDMPTYNPTTTSFISFIPTYSPSASSTSIEITTKNDYQSTPTEVTSLNAPPSAAKKPTPSTEVTSVETMIKSNTTKLSKYMGNFTPTKSSKSRRSHPNQYQMRHAPLAAIMFASQ